MAVLLARRTDYQIGAPCWQAVFVLGLITLLAFAAVEFLILIGLMSQQDRDQ
jgi:hypothetical protein